ncbi:hypothetical protein J6590_017523 [Homalodisca vitripennis]|nr:hypothetical protein J6590_017523 [Homalodisca vitripennis]
MSTSLLRPDALARSSFSVTGNLRAFGLCQILGSLFCNIRRHGKASGHVTLPLRQRTCPCINNSWEGATTGMWTMCARLSMKMRTDHPRRK